MAQLPPSSRTGAAFSMVACPHDERGLHRARQRLESTSFCVRDDMGRKLGVQLVGKININQEKLHSPGHLSWSSPTFLSDHFKSGSYRTKSWDKTHLEQRGEPVHVALEDHISGVPAARKGQRWARGMGGRLGFKGHGRPAWWNSCQGDKPRTDLFHEIGNRGVENEISNFKP